MWTNKIQAIFALILLLTFGTGFPGAIDFHHHFSLCLKADFCPDFRKNGGWMKIFIVIHPVGR